MTTTYNYDVHNYVTFKAPLIDNSFHHPSPIVHHTGEHVWVHATYADTLPDDVKILGGSPDNEYDDNGNCIVSVPVAYVHGYYDEIEAAHIAWCIEADERLLRYAN